MPELQRQFNSVGVRALAGNFIPLFDVDVISYLCPKLYSGLINLC